MRRFVFFPQMDQMDCGPTCLRMIARHYGRVFSAEYLREKCSITREGVSLSGISELRSFSNGSAMHYGAALTLTNIQVESAGSYTVAEQMPNGYTQIATYLNGQQIDSTSVLVTLGSGNVIGPSCVLQGPVVLGDEHVLLDASVDDSVTRHGDHRLSGRCKGPQCLTGLSRDYVM